jgi:amino acid transporter
MSTTGFLSSLNLGTFIIVFIVVAVAFAFFMRRRANRHPMEGRKERNVAKDLDEGRVPPDHSPRQ